MFFGQLPTHYLGKLIAKILPLQNYLSQKPKLYDYTSNNCQDTYVFEALNGGEKGYMTGQGQGVKCGDYILLPDRSGSCRYQVDTIEYYSNPPNMWTALLQKCPQ